jgi:hypothetical protein
MQDKDIFQPLLDLLEHEPETRDEYEAFETAAVAALGNDWEKTLKAFLATLDRKKAAHLEKNLDTLLNYKGALLAWNEAYSYLNNAKEVPVQQVEERLPTLEYWLEFFAEDGIRLLNEVKKTFDLTAKSEVLSFDIQEQKEQTEKEKLLTSLQNSYQTEENNEEAEFSSHVNQEEVLTKEEEKKLWEINNFSEQKAFYNQVTAWINARCIHLGNIEKTDYPYYGITVDILKETLATLDSLLEDKNSYTFIETHSKETILSLQNFKESAEKELEMQRENGFEPVLSLEEKDILKAKELLGEIDRSKTKEYLGPAPDGFVALEDPFATKENNAPEKAPTMQAAGSQPMQQRQARPAPTGRPAHLMGTGQRPAVSGVRPAQPMTRPQHPQTVRPINTSTAQPTRISSRPMNSAAGPTGSGTLQQKGTMSNGRPVPSSHTHTAGVSTVQRPVPVGQGQSPHGQAANPTRPVPPSFAQEEIVKGHVPSEPQMPEEQIPTEGIAQATVPNIPNLGEQGIAVSPPTPPVLPENPDDKR